jgi:hypothetical protein
MSSIDTEELRLYKDPKLYHGSRYKVYQNSKTMEEYLGEPGYKKQVYYKSIDEPITINEFIRDCDEYTYGSITNQGKTYYFFVDQIMTDAYKQTVINFTVDWWSTNWNNIHCTKANIKRQNKAKPKYMKQPYTPLSVDTSQDEITDNYCFMATYIPSSEKGTSYIATMILEGKDYIYQIIDNGQWYNVLDIPGVDIKDCFVVPLFSYDELKSNVEYNEIYLLSKVDGSGETLHRNLLEDFVIRYPTLAHFYSSSFYWCYCNETGQYYTILYDSTHPVIPTLDARVEEGIYITPEHEFKRTTYNEMYSRIDMTTTPYRTYKYLVENGVVRRNGQYVTITNFPIVNFTKDVEIEFETDEQNTQGISDWNGNTVWECPYGTRINKFKVTLLNGLSHVMLQFIPYINNKNNITELLTNKGFCYDCKHPGLFVDSYQDYILKNRDYDVQMRSLQSGKQELQAWISTVENAGFGFAFGQAQGMAASGIGGTLEAIGTRLTNQLYDPKIQKQYDRLYAKMTDQISLIGDSITNVINEYKLIKYTLTMDESTKQIMDKDLSINGYYTEEVTNNLEEYFYDNSVIQAENVVVEGACNVIGKQQIVHRLLNGVEFI